MSSARLYVRSAATDPPSVDDTWSFDDLDHAGRVKFIKAFSDTLQGVRMPHLRSLFDTYGDYEGARRVLELLQSRDYQPEWWLLLLDGPRILGHVVPQRIDNAGWVSCVGVTPHRRREGLGRILLEAGVGILAQAGFDTIHASAQEDDLPWRGLLESCGFHESERIR